MADLTKPRTKTPEKNRRILVVGLGTSGYWTARYMAQKGEEVTVSDSRLLSELDAHKISDLKAAGVILETGGHEEKTFLNAELVVVSPGVPLDMFPLTTAYEKQIPVVGEMELASRFIHEPIIAVTGSNGKSTVTAFLGDMLKKASMNVFVGGNIGTPLMAYAARMEKADYLVVEVSSFQLDSIETFHPYISILLNISPDHLDRYRDYQSYIASKLRIFENQSADDYLILNDEDPVLSDISPPPELHTLRYGREGSIRRNAHVQGKTIVCGLEKASESRFPLDHFSLPGIHNQENLMAAILTGQILGIRANIIQNAIDDFVGLPNRLEYVDMLCGISFYNDSKATNVDAAARAINSFDGRLILIAGGRHKGANYSPLIEAGQGKLKAAVFLGEASPLLARAFEGILPFSLAQDIKTAVGKAFNMASKGDTILLAPACSSFDMFSDYAQRGQSFKTAVRSLMETYSEGQMDTVHESGVVNG